MFQGELLNSGLRNLVTSN